VAYDEDLAKRIRELVLAPGSRFAAQPEVAAAVNAVGSQRLD
jgi:hypothetical protein